MACLDAKLMLSEDIALPATATTEYSTNEIDWGAGKTAWGGTDADGNVAHGTPMYLHFVMTTTAATAASSPTLTLDIVSHTVTAPTTSHTVQNICTAVADTTLVAGYKFSTRIKDFPTHNRFMRLAVTAATGFDVGTYTAWIDSNPLADV